jgi:hypothetical protein
MNSENRQGSSANVATRPGAWARAAALTVHLLAAVALTWPLAARLGTHLPQGAEVAGTIPLFNLWSLRWNADRLAHGYAGYWDAPIFRPERDTLALSEPQPATGIAFATLRAASRSDVAGFGLVVLATFLANGLVATWLLRGLGVRFVPAHGAGLAAQALPFVVHELGVLQLLAVYPIFGALRGLTDVAREPSLRHGIVLGLFVALTGLTCSYYAVGLPLFLALGAVFLGERRHLTLERRATAAAVAVALAVAALMLAPTLIGQLRGTAAYERSDRARQDLSASPADWLRPHPDAIVAPRLPWTTDPSVPHARHLYPGTVLLVLAGGALVALARGPRARWIGYAAVGASLAFVLSLGPRLELGEWRPYDLLASWVPGFAKIRSPFRFAVFGQLCLVILAGLALDGLWRARGAARGFAVLLVAAALVEGAAVPAALTRYPGDAMREPWIAWLAEQPAGIAVHLPRPPALGARTATPVVVSMLQSLEHGKPLGDGYSGFVPASYRALRELLGTFPSDPSLDALRERGIVYVIVARDWYARLPLRGRIAIRRRLDTVYAGDEKLILRLRPAGGSSSARPPEPGPALSDIAETPLEVPSFSQAKTRNTS